MMKFQYQIQFGHLSFHTLSQSLTFSKQRRPSQRITSIQEVSPFECVRAAIEMRSPLILPFPHVHVKFAIETKGVYVRACVFTLLSLPSLLPFTMGITLEAEE